MNLPTVIMIIVCSLITVCIIFIIAKALWYTINALIEDNSTPDEISKAAYFAGRREEWHKEQGHRKSTKQIGFLGLGVQHIWIDKEGNDVTFKQQL